MTKTAYLVLVLLTSTALLIPIVPTQSQIPGPEIDILRQAVFKSPDAQLIAMLTETIDALTGLVRTSDIATLEDAGYTVTSTQGFEVAYLGFNIRPDQSYRRPGITFWPLADANFRHALAHLLPNATTLGDLFGFIAPEHKTMVPPSMEQWYNPNADSHPYNPGNPFTSPPSEHSASGILLAAGYTFMDADVSGTVSDADYWMTPTSDMLPEMTLWTQLASVAPTSFELCMEFINNLGAVGLAATPANGDRGLNSEGVDFSYYMTQVVEYSDFDAYMAFCDPKRFPDHLYDMCHSSMDTMLVPGSHNTPGINNMDVDSLVETVKLSLNHTEKKTAAKDVQALLNDPSSPEADEYALAYMALYSKKYFDAFAPNLQGIVNSYGYGSGNSWAFSNIGWLPGFERIEDSKTVVIWCLSDEPSSLNPLYARTSVEWDIINRVLDPLMTVNPYKHKDEPWLATNWETTQTETSMNVTYNLRDDVFWQDGHQYTAYDAEFSLEFIRDWQIPMYKSACQNISDVTVNNATSFTVQCNTTSQFLIYDWAFLAALLPPQIWDRAWPDLPTILNYDPTESYNVASGYPPGPTPPPTNLFGTGPFIFQFYDPINLYGDLWANRNHFKTNNEIHDDLLNMFHEIGDVNEDGTINVLDMMVVSLALGSTPGDPNWNPNADLTGPSCTPDEAVNEYDLSMVEKHFGLSIGNLDAPPPIVCPPPLYVNCTLTITHTVGGVTKPPAGAYEYVESSTASVVALPDVDYSLHHWELDGSWSFSNPISVTMDKHHSLHAVFIYGPPIATATIEGYITDNETGAPIAGAAVTCNGYANTTDIDGFYQLIDISAQMYTLTVTKEGYETASGMVDASSGGTFQKNMTMIPESLAPQPFDVEWRYSMQSLYLWGFFGSSPAIANMRDDRSGLEVAVGSDEYVNNYKEIGYANGIWRLLDSTGGLVWAKATESDESRSSPAIADLNEDGYFEIAGGTTSGGTVEVLDRNGNFVWTFPHPPRPGSFMWPSSPAVADVDPSVSGHEVIIGNRPYSSVWAFDGDNSDGINDGITVSHVKYNWVDGTEGIDWDVLWIFQTQGSVWSTPAIGDIDNDGHLEVVVGSDDGGIYALNGATGALEWSYQTGSAVRSSAALADLDNDLALEVVIGSSDGKVYCLDGLSGSQQWNYPTGQAVYSSPAIHSTAIFVGSTNGKVYALNASGALQWTYDTGQPIYSSPSIANRGANTGIYIGSGELYQRSRGSGALFLLDASDGTVMNIFEAASIHTSPSVADIDGDGKLEIAFYDWAGNFWCLEDRTSSVTAYSLEWPMFRGNPRRNGTLSSHDITITKVEPYKTVVAKGCQLEINVTATNQGSFTENFNITLYANMTLLATQAVILTSGETTTVTFTWNTTLVAYSNHTMSAVADTVLGEIEVFDNTFINGIVLVRKPGDVNGDGKVDIFDIGYMSAHWYPGPPIGPLGYHPNADTNCDGAVDIFDIGIASANWG